MARTSEQARHRDDETHRGAGREKRQRGGIKLLACKRVSPQVTIYHVELDGREVYFAQTSTSLAVLDKKEIEQTHEQAQPD